MKPLSLIAASAVVALLLVAPALAAGTTVTVNVNQASYSGTEAVQVTGSVSPVPASGQAISFTVTNPAGQSYPLPNTAAVSTTDGSFSIAFNTGGPYYTQSGTYTLTANFQGTTGSTTFGYSTSSSSGGSGISQQQYNDIIGNITALKTQLNALQTSVNGLATTSQVSSLSQAVAGLQSSLNTLSGTVGTINTNVGTMQSTLNGYSGGLSAASNTQTYVLVVAVLAAITLVLELAILVRKLS